MRRSPSKTSPLHNSIQPDMTQKTLMTTSVIMRIITLLNVVYVSCFQMNMNASFRSRAGQSAPSPNVKFSSSIRSPTRSSPISTSSDITSNLISKMAIAALKLRLRAQSSVGCNVVASPGGMIQGRLERATVTGKGWVSPSGQLTCRAIEATVESCHLDTARIFRDGKLRLVVPAKGNAMIAMESSDFGNFVTHPLLESPHHMYLDKMEPFAFAKDGVVIDTESGTIQFLGTFAGEKWRCDMTRDTTNGGVNVTVHPTDLSSRMLNEDIVPPLSTELSRVVTDYFSNLQFDLDGTLLSFSDMAITSKNKQSILLLALKITVNKFPSAGIDF